LNTCGVTALLNAFLSTVRITFPSLTSLTVSVTGTVSTAAPVTDAPLIVASMSATLTKGLAPSCIATNRKSDEDTAAIPLRTDPLLEPLPATTADRNALRRAVTPQVFNHEILITAMGAGPADDSVTDESVLAEVAGFEVAVVEGSPTNIKITHPADMIVAEALIEKETGQ